MNDLISLLKIKKDVDDEGFEVERQKERVVFAKRKSITQSEFYEADRNGYKLAYKFIIKTYEYQGEKYILYHEQKYKIERTYESDTENLELVCSKIEGEEQWDYQ